MGGVCPVQMAAKDERVSLAAKSDLQYIPTFIAGFTAFILAPNCCTSSSMVKVVLSREEQPVPAIVRACGYACVRV